MLAIEEEIFQMNIARGVLLVRGSWFRADANNASVNPSASKVNNNIVEENNSNEAVVAGCSHDLPPAEDPPHLFFRTTFAAVDDEYVTEAIRRFGQSLRDVFGLD